MLLPTALGLCLAIGVNGRSHLGRTARVIDMEKLSNETVYDFVVAGGGIAGLTVADRLTENPDVTVLVIEYGPFDQREDSVMVPGAYFPVPYLWLPLMSTPQAALGGTSYSVPCGRVVGGGSVVNAMFFHRSDAALYDAWEELGATGWSWKGLLPYFKKSETFHPPDPQYAAEHNMTWDESVHGFDGPVQASYAPYDYAGSEDFYNAAVSLGIQPAKDPNNGYAQGIFRLLRSVDPKTQTRSSARVNRYDRDASRPNYHILPSTAVSRVLFKGTTAVGVEYIGTVNGTTKTVRARKEVILAAGSVHTPQILQLSGIGDASLLKSLGIKLISDLPGVGQNLQDHLVLKVTYNFTSNHFPNADSLQSNATYATEQRALYNASLPSAYDITATTGNLIIQLPLANWSEIASSSPLHPFPPISPFPPNLPSALNTNTTTNAKTTIGALSWSTGSTSTIYLTRPFSRGTVYIQNRSIFSPPAVDFNALAHPHDMHMLYIIYRANRVVMHRLGRRLGAREVSPIPVPERPALFAGPSSKSERSEQSKESASASGGDEGNWEDQRDEEEYVKSRIREVVTPSNAHMCCTAAMLARTNGGVVDPTNRVYGTRGLSVVDASVWPVVVGGGPQASVYAGAEKAADLIKERHGLV
ncbi:Nn.00g073790.m01.CDS01 [Neocucurbitaria sp. VM-36]